MGRKKNSSVIDFLLLIVVIISVMNALISLYIFSTLQAQTNNNGPGKFQISLKSVRVNVITSSIAFKRIEVISKSKNPSPFISDKISINHINLYDFLFHRKISVGDILIEDPVITLHAAVKSREQKADSVTQTEFMIYDLFKKKYSSVYIENIKVSSITLKYFSNEQDSTLIFSTSSGTISISKLLIDSNTTYVENKPFSADEFEITLKDITNIVGDSLYTLKIPSVTVSYTKDLIAIDSLRLIPNYEREKFMKVVGKQTDRFDIYLKELKFKGVDVKTLFESFEWRAKNLLIDSLHADIYRNKYIPSVAVEKKFIQEMIRNISIPLRFDSVNVINSYVQYEELLPPSPKSGKVAFYNLSAQLINFSNYSNDSLQQFKVDAAARMDNKTPIVLNLRFPLNKIYFSGSGSTGKINMPDLNSMLEGNSGATITNGIIDSMSFTMHGDKIVFGGNLKMIYHDLRIAAKDIAHNDTSKTKLKIITFIANKFVLNKSNPDKDGKIRSVEMEKDYEGDKFLISNSWKTILQGIQKTIGAPVKKKK